jgi:uncharacterized protein
MSLFEVGIPLIVLFVVFGLTVGILFGGSVETLLY